MRLGNTAAQADNRQHDGSNDAAPAGHRRVWRWRSTALCLLLPLPALATDTAPWLLGSNDGARMQLRERGVDFQLGWSNEALHNLDGGSRTLTRHAGQVALGATLDLERLWNWDGARFQITVDKRYGDNLADDAALGTLLGPHEIYGRGQTWWLTNFHLDQDLLDKRVQLRVGKMPVGSDFGFDQCDFLNLTACGSPPGNIEGRYWHNWPIGPWGARVQLALGPQAHLKLGVYQVNARYVDDGWARDNGWKLDNPSGTVGALVPMELGWTPRLHGLPGDHRVGAWISSAGGDDLYLNAQHLPLATAGGSALHRDRSYGAYLSLQQQLSGSDDGAGLHGFLNLTHADSRTARVNRQITAGLVYRQLPWRPADSVGVMAGVNAASEQYSRFARQWNALHPTDTRPLAGGSEKVVEMFYQWVPQPWLRVRPSLQYIARPGGQENSTDALLLGLKSDVVF